MKSSEADRGAPPEGGSPAVTGREPLPPAAWAQVKALFAEAGRLAPVERASFVAAATDDPQVRDEVLALLAAGDATDGFLASGGAAPAGLEAGTRLGPYEVRERLGRGGMGDVYRAYDVRLHREVAVKVVRDIVLDLAARARFDREARAIAALSHPGVLAVFDVGDAAGVPFIVTELLAGETLRERLRRGPVPVARAIDWAIEIAQALAAAHDKGIIHRDLKPENLFLTESGRVKILDFGVARLLDDRRGDGEPVFSLPGMIIGTAGYLAPEQVRGKPATATADLFALGAVLYELLTGARAFKGDDTPATLRQVVEHDPPPPSTLRPEVSPWLDRVVARCLAKDPAARFQSARDLQFVLQADPGAAPAPRGRRAAWGLALAGVAFGTLGLGMTARLAGRPPSERQPPRLRPLTYSGRDGAPSVSPDGRFLAYASNRDGRSRIWLQQLDVGSEAPLTGGPDDGPRFSPDGSQVLFTRAQGRGTALYRVDLLGGEPRQVADEATDGDWAPDGRRVAFVRWNADTVQAYPSLHVAAVDGSGERELARLDNRLSIRPRWSPDGQLIAVTGLVQQPGAPQTVVVVPVDGTPPRSVQTARRVGLVSAVAWEGPRTLLYSQATSVTGNIAGSEAVVVRQALDGGAPELLLWTPENGLVLDRWPGHGLVFDARAARQNLREVVLPGGSGPLLSGGTASDRQPCYSPDGERIVFSSNRSGNLDVWVFERSSGATQRLTDDPADDWDPAFTPNGRHLLWSSNRSGNFEIWMADADGTYPRQVTHDGVDAENPTATPDGAWIVYSSGARDRRGIWRVRPDGSGATLLAAGAILPEVSPDGRYVLYQTNHSPRVAAVGVASVDGGAAVPFEIKIDVVRPSRAILGRARWMPDGAAIAFVGQSPQGDSGVYVQPFAVGADTAAERRPLVDVGGDSVVESFAVAPRGDRAVVSLWEQRSAVVAAIGSF